MTDTPERERWITPHALLGGTSASAATFTTAGLTMGAAGVVTVAAVGAGVAAGAVALRRFAPGTAARMGLHKPGRTASHTGGHGTRKAGGGARKTASRSGGLGRRGLLGGPGSRRKASHGAGRPSKSRRKAAHGLLGSKRRVAGKGKAAVGRRAAGKRGGLIGRKAAHPKGAAHKAKRGLLGSSKQRRHAAAHKPAGRKHAASKTAGHRKPTSSRKRGLFGLGKRSGHKNTPHASRGTGRKSTRHPSTTKRGTPTASTRSTRGKGLLGGHPQRKAERKAARAAKRNPQRLHGTHPDQLDPRQQRNRKTLRQMFRPASHDGRTAPEGEIMPNPFAGRQESISGSAPLEIERANDLIDYVQHAPDYYEAIANRARIEADAIAEGITIAPEFSESLKGFAESQARQVEKVREYGEVFRRAHSERLRKLEEKDPREEKWDISKNRH